MFTAFDRLIAPLCRDEFFSSFWGKSFIRVPGTKGRFGELLPWGELNCILERQYLTNPRLRLVREGKTVDPGRYVGMHLGDRRLRPASLVNLLSAGATLILDSVQEFAPAVNEVCEAFEEVLHARTTVNVYAGWRTQKGFDLHWDEQDTMIVQVAGRKHWKVYAPTRLHPLREDTEAPLKPAGDPVWDGILEDGDMLYMPRGWWHIAFPLDEPSLHLTVTIVPANGTDLLRWFSGQMREHAEVRRNVPSLAGPAEKGAYISKLRELIQEFWSDDVLDRFVADWSATPGSTRLNLPFAPIELREPITPETRVRLATTDRLRLDHAGGELISFSANSIRWECPAGYKSAVEQLSGTAGQPLRELCNHLPDPALAAGLTAFLTSLAMGGVLWINSPEGSG